MSTQLGKVLLVVLFAAFPSFAGAFVIYRQRSDHPPLPKVPRTYDSSVLALDLSARDVAAHTSAVLPAGRYDPRTPPPCCWLYHMESVN